MKTSIWIIGLDDRKFEYENTSKMFLEVEENNLVINYYSGGLLVRQIFIYNNENIQLLEYIQNVISKVLVEKSELLKMRQVAKKLKLEENKIKMIIEKLHLDKYFEIKIEDIINSYKERNEYNNG